MSRPSVVRLPSVMNTADASASRPLSRARAERLFGTVKDSILSSLGLPLPSAPVAAPSTGKVSFDRPALSAFLTTVLTASLPEGQRLGKRLRQRLERDSAEKPGDPGTSRSLREDSDWCH